MSPVFFQEKIGRDTNPSEATAHAGGEMCIVIIFDFTIIRLSDCTWTNNSYDNSILYS